jgi:hypothetical protein
MSATTLDLSSLSSTQQGLHRGLVGELSAGRRGERLDRPRLGQNDRTCWARGIGASRSGHASDEGAATRVRPRHRPGRPTREASAPRAKERRELELPASGSTRDGPTRRLVEGQSGEERLSAEACEKLKAMGYVQQGCS